MADDNNDNTDITPDDALEETNDQDYDTQGGRHESLPNDQDTPFTPADESPISAIPLDHPVTDSGLDEHEIYDSGVTQASEVDSNHEFDDVEKNDGIDSTEVDNS